MQENDNGPIDINSNITPITKQEIQLVDQSQWEKMPVHELYDQLIILQQRYFAMLDMGKGQIADQIQSGIKHLESLIAYKQTETMRRGGYEVR